jgi:hypothetical protein
MRKLKQGPTEQLRMRKYILKNHIPLENKQLRKRKYKQRYHKTSKEGAMKRNNHK